MTTYQMINSIILEKLEEGVVPWRKMWRSKSGLPAISLTTGKVYNGINQILLYCLAHRYNTTPYFLTYKQALARGGHVKSGEKGFPVFFFKKIEEQNSHSSRDEKKMEEESTSSKFILRFFTVFNLEQCEDISLSIPEERLLESMEVSLKELDPIEEARNLLKNYFEMPQVDTATGNEPAYNWKKDRIYMPLIGQFETAEEYYVSFFHELAHSTGHESRLDRFSRDKSKYQLALEELVGEITAVYLAEEAGISDAILDNSAGYINYWKNQIEGNSRLFTSATSLAEKACRFVLDHSFNEEKAKESA